MATANAMYGRIAEAYALLFSGGASLVLAHGQRLVDDFAASVLPAGDDEHDARQLDDTASARCTAWLADHNKRALLSPAGQAPSTRRCWPCCTASTSRCGFWAWCARCW